MPMSTAAAVLRDFIAPEYSCISTRFITGIITNEFLMPHLGAHAPTQPLASSSQALGPTKLHSWQSRTIRLCKKRKSSGLSCCNTHLQSSAICDHNVDRRKPTRGKCRFLDVRVELDEDRGGAFSWKRPTQPRSFN